MRLPDPDAHYSHRTRFGHYVERRLRRAKRPDMAGLDKSALLSLDPT